MLQVSLTTEVVMSRYKDGRIQTAFRLSPDTRTKLDELAKDRGCPMSEVVRKEIDRAHDRFERRKAK